MVRDEKKRIMVTLTKEVSDALEEIAKQSGLSKSGLVTTWVNANRKGNEK